MDNFAGLLKLVSIGCGMLGVLVIFKLFQLGWHTVLAIQAVFLLALAIGFNKAYAHIRKRNPPE